MLFTQDGTVMATLSASMNKMRGMYACICYIWFQRHLIT